MSAESAGGLALLKIYGLKAILGMLGAALLYMVLPPIKVGADGKKEFDQKEFVCRLAVAGVFSCFFGDWVLQQLVVHAPWLHAENHSKAVDLMTGAPGWWITRGIALWLQKQEGKDIVQIVKDILPFIKSAKGVSK